MKNAPRLFILLGGFALLLLLAGLWLRSTGTAPEPHQTTVPQRNGDQSTREEVSDQPAFGLESPPKTPARQAPSTERQKDSSEFERFNEWAARYVAATEEQRRGLLEEGIEIAQVRRVALRRLIETDPRRAIENAVPPLLRQQLPVALAELLEERVNERGFYGLLGAVPSADHPDTPPYRREVRTSDGGRYHAFVYGRRLSQQTTENAPIVGIAVDDTMAIDERPLRVVASGEIPNHPNNLTRRRTVRLLDEQGFSGGRKTLTTPAPPREVVETCPVSGKSTASAKTEASGAVTAKEIVVEAGGQFHFLCSGGHILGFEEQLLSREGGNGGPVMPTNPPSATPSTGYKTNVLMRVAFPEALKGSVTEKDGHDLGKNVQDWFIDNSYGAMTFMTTVTPLLVLPRSEAWYKDQDTSGSAYEVLTDARAAAKAAGFDPANFNFDTVIFTGTPGAFGGQAYVGGKGCWLKSGTNTGVAAHEYGHNFGLLHANFWTTTNGSAIGGGSHVEYGDSFDTMGSASAGDYHFNACHKNLLNWIPNALVHDVTTSGTYRVYQMDQPAQNPRLRYAIKTRKDADRDYWVDLRQLFSTNAWVQGGIFLHWSPWASSASGSHLLDTTPGSIDAKSDAPIVIGRTFSDPETGIHITPIAKNATTPPSADVVVNLGMFPGNNAPVVAVGASATSLAANASVNFTATASDLDGDVLSYAWDFGDKSFSTTNSPVVSRSWATAGEYRVRCTASDMKGQTASASVIVTVGSPGTFRIAGTITAAGQPLANVRVHNSLTGTSYREAYTDANGTYTLVRLAAGTYTVATQLYGYTLTPTGSASVAVGPNKSGVNFTATNQSVVSIALQDADCAEGANTGTFRISRIGSTASALTVYYGIIGSAVNGTDYVALPSVLTIPSGQSFLDVLVTATDDSNVESYESVTPELWPDISYVLGTAAATLWIGDSDTANPLVRLSISDRDADESGEGGQFVIERLGATTAALNVIVALSGTATNGADYVTIPTTITIPAGASSVPVNVTPLQDSTVETMETVTLTISTNAAYTRPASSTDYAGTVNLHDDDQPIVTVVATDSAAAEAGNDPGVFTVTRTGSTAAALSLNYGLTGSALHGTDYVPLPGVLTIPAGSAVATVVITPIDDAIGEPSQSAVFQLRGGIGYTVGPASNATVTITDNSDLPYASIAVTTGPAIEGGTAGVFRVTTTGTGTGNINVLYTVTGTATNGADFTLLTGSVSMAKNATSNLTITPIQDPTVEGYETVTVTLTPDPAYALAIESSATMNLQDDDAPQVNVSITDDAFNETNGDLARFFVSRTGSTTNALTVNYTLGGTATSGADYTAPSGSVTIAAGATGAFVYVSMLDDALAEGTETIVLNVTPGATYSTGFGSATRYIIDAELAAVSTQVHFSTGNSSAAESAGTVNIPVTLNAAAAGTLTVEYFINGGNALAAGIDYGITPGVLTFLAGETSKNIQVAINDDPLDESNETLTVSLANPYNAKLGTSSHTLTITDNDAPPGVTVGFAGTTGSGLESQSPAPLTVALSTAQAAAVTVDYAVTGGTATGGGSDYAITAGTLTFAIGETVKVIPNTMVDDASVDSGETIILTLSNPGGAVLSANPVFTYTITDDDAATVTIVATDASAAEPGSDTGLFTVARTGSTTASLTVNFSISGTATSGADYANLASTVVIAAGASTATVLLTPVDDNVIDPAESVILTLTPGVYTIGAENNATVTIADDEVNVIVTIAATDANAAEVGDPGAFTVTRAGSTVDDLTVNLSSTGTATAGSDYTALATSVVIPAASASAIIPVSPLADIWNEGDETVILTALAGPGYSRGSPASATVTIANTDDGSPPILAPGNIVDDKGGASVFIDTLVTYTVTFSKDMDASTVTAADFGNAGSATVTMGSVTETSPTSGVFTVQATPTNGGTLQLKINAGAVLKSAAGTNLDTTAAIADNTTITVSGTAPTLADALDTSGFTWTNSGNASWFYQTSTTHDGIDAGQSGAIDHNQNSYVETTVTGPGTLTFWWKVSSETNYDYLRFYLDGTEQTESLAPISGTVNWVQKTVSIPSGSHTVKWGYTKDFSVVAGSDAAWVDQVVYTPTSAPEIAVEQPVGTNLVDGSASIDSGSISLGSSSSPITVTVRNTGTANLTGLALTKDGTHNADYTLGSLGVTTLTPGTSTTFSVTFSPSAAGARNAAIHLASNDADETPFDIALTGTGVPLGTLAVTPAGNLTSSGSYGGSFTPASQDYTLSNIGSTPINWTAGKTAAWVDLSATSGTLAAGASTTVTASINANANTLAIGGYSETVTFTNTTNSNGNTTRGVSLTVNPIPATFNFSNLLQTYNGAPKSATVATTPPGLAHSVTYDGSPIAPTNAGTYAVAATIAEPNYSGSGSASMVIPKASQSVDFAALDPIADDQPPFALTATATSGLSVSYTSSNTAVATVSGSTVTLVGPGSTDITASQVGDSNYNAAAPVVQTLTVVRSNPLAVITGGPYKVLIGQLLSLNGSASQPSYGETISTYEWDLNNDNSFGDVTGATPTAISFATLTSTWGMVQGLNIIQLKVTDSASKTSIVSTTVELVLSLTWDANGATAGQTNGAGAWLGTNQWWDGTANQTWASGSNATFGGPSTAGGAVTLASPTNVNLLTFNTFTGTYTLGAAAQTLTINGGITKNAGSGVVTFVSPMILGASQSWTNNSTGAIGVSGSRTLDNGGFALAIDGSGDTSFAGSTGNEFVIRGSGGITKNGGGRLYLGSQAAPVHTYSGTTTLNGGVTMISASNLGTGNLTLNGGVIETYWNTNFIRALGAGAGQMQLTGGASGFGLNGNTSANVILGNNAANEAVWGSAFFNPSTFVLQTQYSQSTSSLNFQNKLDLNGADRTIQVSGGVAGTATATISGIIRNSTGTAGIIKTGNGQLTLSTANTYNGVTTISAGPLVISNASALGTTSGNTTIAATGSVNGAQLKIGNNITSAENITITGTTEAGSYAAAISNISGTNILSGNITLSSTTGGVRLGAAAGTLTFSGGISQTTSTNGLAFITSDGAAIVVNNAIANNGAALDIYNGTQTTGTGTVTLKGVSGSGLGNIKVWQTGNLKLGVNNALNTSADLILGAVNTTAGYDAGTFDLAGFNQTVNALIGNRNTSNVGADTTRKVTNSAAGFGTNTLAVGNGDGSGTFNGVIVDGATAKVALIKTGSGTQTLAGPSTYTGATTVTGGTLALGASNALPNTTAVSVGSATLSAGAGFTDTAGTLDVTGTATINLGAGATLAFDNSSSVDWTGGTLTITGTFVPGSSLRFGTSNTGLTSTQLAKISAIGFGSFILDANGYLTVDVTPPTLVSITDDKSSGSVPVNTLVTYTVTFGEDMDASTVSAADFGNAGTSTVTIGTVTETTPGVFSVRVTPTSAGALRLQVNAGAELKDVAGNPLVNTPPLLDDTTVTVNPGAGYATWASTHAPTGTAASDFDGDGVSNGVEYVLGGTAPTNDHGKLSGVSILGGNVIFSFNRAQASIDGTTTVAIETGTELGIWPGTYAVPDGAASNNPGVSVVKNTSPGFDTITLSIAQGADGKTFVRLKVVTPTP